MKALPFRQSTVAAKKAPMGMEEQYLAFIVQGRALHWIANGGFGASRTLSLHFSR